MSEIPRLVEIEQELAAWRDHGDRDIFSGADETTDYLLTLLSSSHAVPVPSVVDRDTIAEVLVEHQRLSMRACGCGWDKLGQSHSYHVADAVVAALNGPSK